MIFVLKLHAFPIKCAEYIPLTYNLLLRYYVHTPIYSQKRDEIYHLFCNFFINAFSLYSIISLHIRIDDIVADRQVGLGQNVLSRNFLYFHFICL